LQYTNNRSALKAEGILVDAAINAFHRPDRYISPHLEGEMAEKVEAYKRDPRNKKVIKESLQKRINFKIGKNSYYGKLDQVREYNGKFFVFDVKYSLVNSKKLLYHYIPSLVIYAYSLNIEVGGIINVRNYKTGKPVFILADGIKVKNMMKSINDTIIYKLYKEGVIKCS
jgi:hypothetical protein